MATLTNSEGKILTYTNELIETILLQLISSSNYYTTGDDDIIFIKIGSNRILLLLGYTYHINRAIFQNYAINKNTIRDYSLQFILNNTNNEYTLQGVYNANGSIGSITGLSQVFLAIYDTAVSPQTYTGSESIDITSNEISLGFPLKIYDEIVLNPRLNYHSELYAGTPGITFLQNIVDGSQPPAILNSLDKSVEFFGDLDIPNFYNKTELDAIGDELSALVLNTYTKTEVGALIYNINLVGYYTKTEVDTQLTDNTTIRYLQGNYMTTLAITGTLMNNYATITLIICSLYSKTETDSPLSNYITPTQIDASYYTKSEIGTTLNLYSPSAQILNVFIASFKLIMHFYPQPKQEHLITIKLKLMICHYTIVLVLMLVITFTLKLKLILF